MKYVVGYSGGADSQVALDLALQKFDDVEIVFIDTSIEFPETLETIEDTARFYNMDIRVLRAPKTFEEYLESFGGMYPSWRRRWCQDRLKERPWKKYMNLTSPAATAIDGIRGDESRARAKRSPVEPHRSGNWMIEHIIFTWTKPEVFQYIHEHRLPLNPLYAMGYSRVSCWFCPFSPKADNQILPKLHPDLYAKAQEWAEKYGRRFCYPVEDQAQASL